MAKVSQLSRIKTVRVKSEISYAMLAQALAVSEADIRSWEKDASKVSEPQLRDLALVLDVPVADLLGAKPDDDESPDTRFARSVRSGLDYGTLRLTVGSQQFDYPIDVKAFAGVSTQLENRNPQEDSKSDCWMATWSLNDKLVYANLAHLTEVEMIGDDAEEMPRYEHPEVYRLLGMWEILDDLDDPVGPVLMARCQAYIEEHGTEDSSREATHARVVFKDGTSTWHHLLELEDTIGYHVLELEAGMGIPPNSFIRVASEGYYRARYVNLSQAALIEVPATRFFAASNGG